ncbi:MAG: hypothetical protein SV253_08835 [Halobacteria archaeon]|nr:hypothetical protein [Halobacteria archaeon]
MLPDCETVYENLKTSFVDVEALRDDIERQGLSGYLRFEGNGEEGVTVFEDGMAKTTKIEGQTRTGTEVHDGFEEALSSLESGEYRIEVADCGETELEIIRNQMTGEKIEEDLSTRYINLRNYLLKLDDDFDGYLTINEEEIQGMVTIDRGDASGAILETDGEAVMGNEAVDEILSMSESRNLHLDVYKVEAETEDGETTDEIKQEIEKISEDFEDKADEILDDMGLDPDEL